MIGKGLRDLLCNDATIGPMVGGQASPFVPGNRVRPIMLPEGSNYPAIVFLAVSTAPLTSMDGVNALQMTRYQLDCYGQNVPQAKLLAQAVHNLLDGYKGTLSDGTEIQSCLPNSDVDGFEYDAQVFCIHLDFNIRFIEA